MVKFIKTKAEFDTLLEESKNKPVFIDFTATWCGPCQFIGPYFEELSSDKDGGIFVKIDVDENGDVAASCGVSAMPTFQVYKDGKKVDELVGASKNGLKALVDKYT